jgi:hypothetical protein
MIALVKGDELPSTGYFRHADFAARFIRKNGLHGRKYCGNSV